MLTHEGIQLARHIGYDFYRISNILKTFYYIAQGMAFESKNSIEFLCSESSLALIFTLVRTTSLLNSPDLRFVARDGIRASKDGRAGGLRGLLGTKLRWDQRKDSFTQGSARTAGGS